MVANTERAGNAAHMDQQTNDIRHLTVDLVVRQMINLVLDAGTVAGCPAAVATLAQPNSPKLASTPRGIE
tara:strand:- start:90 stop:299 length:210 start_codon:yes stop_codon:yes gene_type:complete